MLISKVLGGIFLGLANYKLINIITDSNRKIVLNDLPYFVLYSVLLITNYLMITGALRLIFGLIIITLIFKKMLKNSLYKSLILGLISYFVMAICEIFIIVMAIIVFKIEPNFFVENITGNLISNILAGSAVIVFASMFKKRLIKINTFLNNKEDKVVIIFGALVILIIGSLFFKCHYQNWEVNKDFVINSVLIITFSLLIINLLLEKSGKIAVNNEYEKLLSYVQNTENILEKYQEKNHEFKNHMAIVSNLSKKHQKDYIKEILKSDDKEKDLLMKHLINLPNGGIKGIVYHKLEELTNSNINIEVNINKNFRNLKMNKKTMFDISKTIAILLDNAKEASIKTEDKIVAFDIYKENESFIISISNTSTTVDYKNIEKLGFSTKENHKGYGLKIAREIINSNKFIELETIIEEKYFVQNIKIKE